MIADDGQPLKALLHGVIFVPGLKMHIFSVAVFASRGHYAIVKKKLMFGQEKRPCTLMLKNGIPVANNVTVKQFTTVPVSSAEVWNDFTVRMSPDYDGISCRISTIKATARIKHQPPPVTKAGKVIYVDILPPVSAESLTPKSHSPALLILVDAFSRSTRIISMPNKSSQSVISMLSIFATEHRFPHGDEVV